MKKTLALLLALLTVLGLLAGCAKDPAVTPDPDPSPTPTPTPGPGEPTPGPTPDPVKPAEPWTYYYVRTGEETTLSPHEAGTSTDLSAADRCTGTMYCNVPSADGMAAAIAPVYADGEPTVDASGKIWTIKLRKDAKWPDGDPITADDWVYSWKMILDPNLACSYGTNFASNYITIKNAQEYWGQKAGGTEVKWEDVGIKKVDDYTVTIECTSTFTAVEVMRQLCRGVSGLVKEELHAKCISADGTTCDYGSTLDKLACAGQFTVESWTKGVEIVYVKNPNWPLADLIHMDKMISRVVTDESTRLELFEKNEADHIVLGTNGLAKYGEDPRLKEYTTKKIQTIEVNQNHSDPVKNAIFNDPQFRQGLFYAVDRAAIAKLNNGIPTPYHLSYEGEILADGTLYRDLPEAKALVEKWAPNNGYDPAKAKSLVEAVLKKNGVTKLDMVFLYDESNAGRRQASEYLDAQFDIIFGGMINLELKAVPSSAMKDTMRSCWKNGPVDSWELGWTGWELAAETYYPWKKFERYLSDNKNRYSAYKNDKLDAIYAACMQDENRLDEQKLAALTVQGEEAWYEDMTSIPVYVDAKYTLFKDHVELPMKQYTAGLGFGWYFATRK